MSEATIWNTLRAAGLSENGTAAVMGNMMAESLLSPINVEDRSGLDDQTYTDQVDNGSYSENTFIHDSYGYGLCQWTYYTRKQGLYNLAKSKGVSIGDEAMQVEWFLSEMNSYPNLLSALKANGEELYNLTCRVCSEFEAPAYCNYSVRFDLAQRIYGRNAGTAVDESCKLQAASCKETDESCKVQAASCKETDESCKGQAASSKETAETVELAQYQKEETLMPLLSKGSKGIAVGMLQWTLNKLGFNCGSVDCDFGPNTANGLNAFKAVHGLNVNGICNPATWEVLYQ